MCELISSRKDVLFESDKTIALLSPTPSAVGHVVLLPKEHFPIFEKVPDVVVKELFQTANKLSIAAFEGLRAEGTNILVQNGVSAGQSENHFMLHVLPRKQNDNISFPWNAKQLSEEELSGIEAKLKDETFRIGLPEPEKPKPVEAKKPKEISDEKEQENYLLKQLERLP